MAQKVLWLLGERPAGLSGVGVMLVLVLPLALLANPLSCVQAPGAAKGALGALLLGSVLFGIDLDAGRGIGAWKSRESSGVTAGRTRPRRLLWGKSRLEEVSSQLLGLALPRVDPDVAELPHGHSQRKCFWWIEKVSPLVHSSASLILALFHSLRIWLHVYPVHGV